MMKHNNELFSFHWMSAFLHFIINNEIIFLGQCNSHKSHMHIVGTVALDMS
jgi:putative lipase involved disintegration of autophagic bodies